MNEYEVSNIVFDKPNKNDRIYTQESFSPYKNKEIFVVLGESDSHYPDITKICGIANNLVIKEDRVFATVDFFGPLGPLAKTLNESIQFDLIPIGIGKIDNNIVSDYKLLYFSLSLKKRTT